MEKKKLNKYLLYDNKGQLETTEEFEAGEM